MTEDDELFTEDVAELIREYCLNYFEGMHARDGSFISVEQLYRVIEVASRTEVRDAVETFGPNDILQAGREAGTKIVVYKPFAKYKWRLHKCHEEADESGGVSPTLIKLLLQEFVVLDQDQRDVLLQELVEDERRSVKMSTFRRARVDRVLHDSLITFRVAPEPS